MDRISIFVTAQSNSARETFNTMVYKAIKNGIALCSKAVVALIGVFLSLLIRPYLR